ncbi:putative protein with SCP/PR1 domains [Halorhabdus sp. SVX81]|uniref:CAP domain-containing protein n=1 Tax=Halorhabdus sp. SVX81 TaxID=2978283 RepID=UPI0023DA9449|nr:CAP domain-containing protein [Halorhabdus sp. SVX81]WEL17042.1 putative protein with SCP/PR1 domains [Halorhabdus sp. SVX81]
MGLRDRWRRVVSPVLVWAKRSLILGLVIGLFVVGISATVGTGIPAIDTTTAIITDSERDIFHNEDALDEGTIPGEQSTPSDGGTAIAHDTLTGEGTPSSQVDPDTAQTTNDREIVNAARINQTQIESQVHQFINEERSERGLASLSFNDALQEIARYHSQDMAERRYFAHTAPDGEDMGARYSRFDFQCEVQISDRQYATGAENIAYTYADTNVVTDGGTVNYNRNETRIAQGLVDGWMNSPGHRANILKSYWQSEGIGIAITETDEGIRVYATQNFC